MKDFTKVVRIGSKSSDGSVFVQIEYERGRLSLSGVVAPTEDGDAVSCGQIKDELVDFVTFADELKGFFEYAEGWNKNKVLALHTFWDLYHLNDMHAGTEAQTDFLRALHTDKERGFDYTQDCKDLEEAGLLTIPSEDNYQYGTRWLTRPVPQDVLDWLYNLPDADREPAWI